jgi:hypothetical protein
MLRARAIPAQKHLNLLPLHDSSVEILRGAAQDDRVLG